ncbi:DUF6916 family protein [Arthrobacter sp. HLT1-20]
MSRRSLIAGGAGALVLLVGASQASTATPSEPYSFQAWSNLLGKDVKVDGGATLRVEQVVDLRKPAVKGEVDSNADRFRLHFAVVAGTLDAELITVQHPQAGPVVLFTTQGAATAVASIDRRGATMLPLSH